MELQKQTIIDVRTSAEFDKGHIPGAYNIPLFNELERAEIGTLYKVKGRSAALERGLEIVSPNIPRLYRAIKDLINTGTHNNDILVHCWRGGLRSSFVAYLMNFMDIKVQTLNGGYKAYRQSVLKTFEQVKADDLIVLDGFTGTGKTELLTHLKDSGFSVIDLEGIASHRGSIFGGIKLPDQPTQQQFENLLATEISRLSDKKPIILEGESKRIGKLTIPTPLHESMERAKRIIIEDSLDSRVNRILNIYSDDNLFPTETVLEKLDRIKRHLGSERFENYKREVLNGEKRGFIAKILTEYYDPLYDWSFKKRRENSQIVTALPSNREEVRRWFDSQNL